METNAPDRESVVFMLRLARALHNYGTPAHQIEDALTVMSRRLRIRSQFFVTPTSILISYGPMTDERVHLMRVEPGDQDLGRLADVFDVVHGVGSGQLTPAQGTQKLDESADQPSRYGPWVTAIAISVASTSAARFLGGGTSEVVVAAVIGLSIGLLNIVAGRVAGVRRMFEPLASFVAALLAGVAWKVTGPLSVYLATLAGIIILIPGFTLTVAITELSNKHLQAGTARLFSAFTTFIVIVIGVAIGAAMSDALVGVPPPHTPSPLHSWTEIVALLVAPLAFSVLLKAKGRDFPWILLTCTFGFIGTRLGSVVLGPDLGMFVGALLVGICGSAYYKASQRPPAIVRVPGLLLLVPGSIGFRSLTALLDRQVVSGVEALFRMITIAAALAAGLLISSVAFPTRITARFTDMPPARRKSRPSLS